MEPYLDSAQTDFWRPSCRSMTCAALARWVLFLKRLRLRCTTKPWRSKSDSVVRGSGSLQIGAHFYTWVRLSRRRTSPRSCDTSAVARRCATKALGSLERFCRKEIYLIGATRSCCGTNYSSMRIIIPRGNTTVPTRDSKVSTVTLSTQIRT